MTPEQLSKSGTERANQVALFAWAAVATRYGFAAANLWADTGTFETRKENPVACLEWLHAIHNQGHGDAIHGARAKAEGVRAGIPDICLPFPAKIFNGLYIELKKPSIKPIRENSKGGLSDEQIRFAEYAKEKGYAWHVAYGWQEAAKIIQDYLS